MTRNVSTPNCGLHKTQGLRNYDSDGFGQRIYLFCFQKTLTFVSSRANIKPVLMAVQTLGTTGTGGQTHLILALLGANVSVF